VGIIRLTPSVADGNYLGAGDVSGTQSGNIGRFYAAKLALSGGVIANRTGLAACPSPAGCGTYTYMGEQMSAAFNLTAKAQDGTTTLQNYTWSATVANQFAKLNLMAAVSSGTGGPLAMGAVNSAATRTPFIPCATTAVHPCLTPAQATAGTFALGVANSVTVPFALYRNSTTVSGPYPLLEIGIAPVDSDNVALATYDLDTVNIVAGMSNHTRVGSTQARYGRFWINNAYGSELLPLSLPVSVEYWNGSRYIVNTDDSLSLVAAALSSYSLNLNPGETLLTQPVILNGSGSVGLSAPGSGNNGSVDVPVTSAIYLPGNTGRATFGVYEGKSIFIYQGRHGR
jgi:MSHA biogenesis protein MshQ